MTDTQRGIFAVLASIEGVSARHFATLLSQLASIDQILSVNKATLVELGLSVNLAHKVFDKLNQVDPVEYLDRLKIQNINILIASEPDYPRALKHIQSAPYVLFSKGFCEFERPLLAIVGTRKPSEYGRQVTETLAKQLSLAGVILVSGLAFGVDSVAHQAVVDTQGIALAVLAGGIDNVQPASSQKLATQILKQGGGIVSEYAPKIPWRTQYFPARNRIVSGLSQGVLVVEGTADSGTLITAEFARKQNRLLFAVPGSITNPMSIAPNRLIKAGAIPVTEVSDILNKITIQSSKIKTPNHHKKLTENDFSEKNEWLIYQLLIIEECHIDTLAKELKINIGDISAILTILELKGIIKHIGNKVYGLT